MTPSRTVIAELPGISATFSPAASTVAYLKIVESPELAAAAKALDDAPLAVQNRNALIQALNYQVLRSTHHRLARPGRHSRSVNCRPPACSRPAWCSRQTANACFSSAGPRQTKPATTSTQLPTASRRCASATVAVSKACRWSTRAARRSTYVISNQNPFRRPQPPGGGGVGAGQGAPRPPSFGVIDLATNRHG